MQEQQADDLIFKPKQLEDNEEQSVIQQSRHAFVIVEANAGAAKTTTLARRIAQALHSGAPPSSILALTYTQPACVALANALQTIGVDAAARRKLRIVTFEDFASGVLQKIEGSAVPLHSTAEQLKPFVQVATERVLHNLDERFPNELILAGSSDTVVEQLLLDFLRLKGTMQLVFEAEDRAITPSLASELGHEYATLRVFSAYERERKGGNPDRPRFRGAGDSTYDLARLLMAEDIGFIQPHPLELGFSIVAVDEMHDMNRAMFTVLKSLVKENRRAAFIGVGDRDQVIHAVAGADHQFLGSTFDQEIGNANRYPLTGSYRFGPVLAKVAGKISQKPYKSLSTRKTSVALQSLHGATAHQAITEAAKKRVGLGEKSPASQFAVLIRHPHQSIGLENALLQADVPYRVAGFESYLFRPEILLVRGLLAYAAEDFSALRSPETRARILRSMLLFGRAKIDTADDMDRSQSQLEKEAIQAVSENDRIIIPFFENQILRTAAPDAALRMRNAVEAARSSKGPDGLRAIIEALDLQHLASNALVESARIRQVMSNIAGLLASASAHDSPATFFSALNGFEVRQDSLKTKESILLSSVEASKGLEFDHVVLPNMSQGEFALAGNSVDDRNLFYVAITRAKNQLSIYFNPSKPSKYLVDAGLLDELPQNR